MCLNLVAARYSQEKRNAFLAKHHQQYERFLTHIRRIIEKKPLVTAALLQSKGILPSKQMGTLLKVAEELAIIRDLHDAEFVISLLKETESWPKKEMPCEK